MTEAKMISISDLSKAFGPLRALNSINLEVEQGELFGLLGPNGAGKTTLIRLLTTLSKPDQGQIAIAGRDINRDLTEVKQLIGIVPQHNNLDQDLTAIENLLFGGMLFKMPYAAARSRAEELIDFFGLNRHAATRARVISGGEKRKVMLARALMHQPQLLFLDEPTVGLDPVFRKKMWNYIKQLNTSGITILLTTHYIEEAEALCSRICLLNAGILINEGSPEELTGALGRFTVEYFASGSFNYRHFLSRKEAAIFASTLNGRVTMRRTNLEDVFFAETKRKVGDDTR